VHGENISSDTQTQSCLFSIMAISACRKAGVPDCVRLHTCMWTLLWAAEKTNQTVCFHGHLIELLLYGCWQCWWSGHIEQTSKCPHTPQHCASILLQKCNVRLSKSKRTIVDVNVEVWFLKDDFIIHVLFLQIIHVIWICSANWVMMLINYALIAGLHQSHWCIW